MDQPVLAVPGCFPYFSNDIHRISPVWPGILVVEIINKLFYPNGILRRQDTLLKETSYIAVRSRIHINGKGRKRLIFYLAKPVFIDRSIIFRIVWITRITWLKVIPNCRGTIHNHSPNKCFSLLSTGTNDHHLFQSVLRREQRHINHSFMPYAYLPGLKSNKTKHQHCLIILHLDGIMSLFIKDRKSTRLNSSH